jgi:hypothetical protein
MPDNFQQSAYLCRLKNEIILWKKAILSQN